MISTKIARFKKIVPGLFSDESLTKKATLNSMASGLDYFAQLAVGFIITPLMVTGLGDYFYGIWQIMNRLFSYISTTSGSTSALKWTLAKELTFDNDENKRRYVGSAIAIWGLILPITGVVGGLITWFVPYWLSAPVEFYWQIRVVAGLFMLSVALSSLAYMPQAILQGQNQGYRRIGLSVVVFFFNGGLTWLALYLKTGIIGVSVSVLFQTFIAGCFYFMVCRSYIPWFGIQRPSSNMVRSFFNLSVWFLAWDVVANMTNASDVVVLGLLSSVDSVTSYTLSKYLPETLITIIAVIVVAIIPGLGSIIGKGDLKRAAQVRSEILSLTWLVITAIGSTILLWNRSFLGLWVGGNRYVGTIPGLLIMIVVVQFVLIRTDGFIIDLTLRVQKKVIYGALSVLISVIVAGILVKFFGLGVIGVSIGLIIGRSILSVTYPIIACRFLEISFFSQLKNIGRPTFAMALLYILATILENLTYSYVLSGIYGWIVLVLGVGFTVSIFFLLAFFVGLSSDKRKMILLRINSMISIRDNK